MRHLILCQNHIIKELDLDFYEPIENCVPIGYRFVWAWSSIGQVQIVVDPILSIIKNTPVQAKEVTNLGEFKQEQKEMYRVEM